MGDQVFGFTLFGAYSSLLLVPGKQIRKIPQLLGGKVLSLESAAALPAVAATALHAISQAGAWPEKICTKNRSALVHSAAGTSFSPASLLSHSHSLHSSTTLLLEQVVLVEC